MGGEMMVAKWSGWCHAHRGHSLLLGDGGLTLLISPVATDCAGTKPLAIHGAKRPLSLSAIAESNESIATGAACLHVPHDTGFGYVTKGGEGLQQYFIVDLVGKVTDEDVEVIRGVFLCRVVGLIGPVDANFLTWSAAPIVSWWGGRVRTVLCTRRPFKVDMARSAAAGSSYSTNP